mmetsp:Transcript_1196/g.1661  ORF Transcript_1196/g.1661 Transcript_1196/m.1661 type:complete len:118 (-) Transcript_1196:103-456(-)
MPDTGKSREDVPMSRRDQLIFFKMLLEDLSKSDPPLCMVAKNLVKECIKRHREGDPDFEYLDYVTKQYLRATVGDIYWKRTEKRLKHFKNRCIQRKRWQKRYRILERQSTEEMSKTG